jgi:hypothetical protein
MQTSALPANDDARKNLERALSNLTLPMPQGAASSPLAAKISGRKFVFPANGQNVEAITFESGTSDRPALVVRVKGTDYRLTSGHGAWQKGRVAYGALTNQPVAVAGAWTTEDTYTAKLCFHETPTSVTANLKFSGDQLLYDAEYNVAFGPAKQPQLAGRAE